MKRALAVLTIFTLVALTMSAQAGEANEERLDLRLRLNKGDTYVVTTTIEKSLAQWQKEVESIETAVFELTQTIEVLDVDDEGTTTIKVTYTRYTVKAQNEDAVFVFDSNTPLDEQGELATLNAVMIGHSFKAKLSPCADAVALEDLEDLHTAFVDAAMQPITHPAQTWASIEVPSFVSVSGIKDLLADLFGKRPETPLLTGDSWTQKEQRHGKVATTCDRVYSLESHLDDVATIHVKGNHTLDPNTRQHGDATANFEVTLEGTYRLDEASGMTIEAKLRSEIAGEKVYPPADGQKMPFVIPMTIDTTTTIKCTKQP